MEKTKFIVIWYDMDSEKKRDVVYADDEDGARSEAYLKYTNCEPPAKLTSVIKCLQ